MKFSWLTPARMPKWRHGLTNCYAIMEVPTFFSPSKLVGGHQWQDEILQGLQRCDWFVVLLSPSAVNSMWVKREIAYALSDERYENRIVPLLYRDCDLDRLAWLKLFQIVNFRGEFEDGCRDLLRVWGLSLEG
jgi:hypothetical protein